MPYENVWIDALLWATTILVSLAGVLWWEARQRNRQDDRPVEPPRHVRVLGPADVDQIGRVEKIGINRHAPACHDTYCVCGLADLDGEVVA